MLMMQVGSPCGREGSGSHNNYSTRAAFEHCLTLKSCVIPQIYLAYINLAASEDALCFLFAASQHSNLEALVQQPLHTQLPNTTRRACYNDCVSFLLQNRVI